MAKRDRLGKFQRGMTMESSHQIFIGEYDGENARAFMTPDGKTFVQIGQGAERDVKSLLELTLRAVQATAQLEYSA